MNPLKYLENRIRGWLPKQPNVADNGIKMAKNKVSKRRKENTFYSIGGVVFSMVLAVALALLGQYLLSFGLIVLAGVVSLVLLPRAMEIYRQKILEQIQETDVSTPLKLRDFLTWKAWIKLIAIYGFRKMITLYSILNIIAVTAIMWIFIAIGIMTPILAIYYSIIATIVSIIVVYRQLWRAFKETEDLDGTN